MVQADDATVIPSPSATPTPSIPSAEDLLSLTDKAMMAKGTYHSESRLVGDVKKQLHWVEVDSSDQDLVHNSFRSKDTDTTTNLTKHPHRTTTKHSQTISVGDVVAVRPRGGKWKCTDLSGILSGPNPLPSDSSSDVNLTATNMGSEQVNGTAVWHVRITLSLPGLTPANHPAVEDVYINQADDTIVRMVVALQIRMSAKVHGKTKTFAGSSRMTENESRYGEPLTISLPSACSSHFRLLSRQSLQEGWRRAAEQVAVKEVEMDSLVVNEMGR